MFQVDYEWYNLDFIKFREIHTLLNNSSSKVSKEFALFEKLFQLKKKKRKSFWNKHRSEKHFVSYPELRWILLNGTFHFLFPRAIIPFDAPVSSIYRELWWCGTWFFTSSNCDRSIRSQKLYWITIIFFTIRTTLITWIGIIEIINVDKYFRWKVYTS